MVLMKELANELYKPYIWLMKNLKNAIFLRTKSHISQGPSVILNKVPYKPH